MKRHIAVLGMLLLLSACTTYIVKESSEDSGHAPFWTVQSKAHRIDLYSEAKQNLYFVDTAQDANRRLCFNSAKLNTIRKLAFEVSQDILALLEKENTSENNLTSSVLNDKLQQHILVELTGESVAGQYWEQRQYLKEKGAEKDDTVYKCDVLIKIKKIDLANTVKSYKTKKEKTLSAESKKALDTAIDSYVAHLKNEPDHVVKGHNL